MNSLCQYCNPEFYVIYGICGNCGRKCHKPLIHPNDPFYSQKLEDLNKDWIEEPYGFKDSK